MKYKYIDENFVLNVNTSYGIEISNEEYMQLNNIIRTKPTPPCNYDYRLRADTLEWELVELPPAPEEDEEATAEDYEEALGRLGV